MKSPPEPPRFHVYLDATEIENMYSQTVDEVISEITKGNERTVSLKLSLSQRLSLLLFGETTVSMAGETSQKAVTTQKSSLSTLHKLQHLRKYLKDTYRNSIYHDDLSAATSACRNSRKVMFIDVETECNLPQVQAFMSDAFAHPAKSKGINEMFCFDKLDALIEKDGGVVFELLGTPVGCSVKMIGSANKTSGLLGGSTREATVRRVSKQGGIPTGIFGLLSGPAEDGTSFFIKPLAVWWL